MGIQLKINADLHKFLQSQKLLALATVDSSANPWVANVYFSVDKDLNLFFVSSPSTQHSQHLHKRPKIAFSIAWYDQDNLANRKAIQGIGTCELLEDTKIIIKLLKNHHNYYPLWKDIITHENMLNNVISSRPYLIKPKYMKFWNDELYGQEGNKVFKF